MIAELDEGGKERGAVRKRNKVSEKDDLSFLYLYVHYEHEIYRKIKTRDDTLAGIGG